MSPSEKIARLAELKESMNPKYRRVCDHMLAGMDKGAAWMMEYKRVKKKDTASQNCCQNLKKPQTGMAEYIELSQWLATASAAEKLGIDQEYVLSGLKTVAERCMEAVPVMERGPDGKMVETGEWKFEHAGANRSLELMGKELGMFKDKVEVDASNPLADMLERIAASRKDRGPLPSGE